MTKAQIEQLRLMLDALRAASLDHKAEIKNTIITYLAGCLDGKQKNPHVRKLIPKKEEETQGGN